MSTSRRWMLTFACLLGAVACYVIGMAQEALLLLGLGLVLEVFFWFRVFDLGQGQRRRSS